MVILNVNKTLRKAKSLARQGDTSSARGLYEQVLAHFPANKPAAHGLIELEKSQSRYTDAQHRQLQLALQDLVSLFNAGQTQRALAQAKRLAQAHPEEPLIHNLMGAACTALRQYSEAIACFQRAIKLQPDYAEAFSNLGAACNETGNQSGAIAAYSRALKLQPGFYEAHNNLGNVYRDCARLEEALASYRRATELKPDFAAAHNNLGTILSDLGRYDEGAKSCAKALAITSDFGKARGMLLHQLAQMCDWPAIDEIREQIPLLGVEGDAVIPFVMLQLEDNPASHAQRSIHFARNRFRKCPASSFARPAQRPKNLRIAYFSSDFCNHATLYLMARLFELHNTDRFEIHAFSNSPNDGGEMRQRLTAAVNAVHDITQLSDREAAALSRRLGMHIAVDLKGYTKSSRLGALSHRAAPVQVTWIGYPGTTGTDFIDYIIGDATVTPPGSEAFYTENIIRLADSYQVNDNTRQVAQGCPTRAEAGLPASGFVFSCFNNCNKITSREFDIWMRLLQAVDGSVLWLLQPNRWAEANLREQARQRDVNPDRLVFAQRVPHAEHLARHALADLSLDTFNYNAHTTTSDALWAGLPIITKLGAGFAARVGASLLRAAGMPELVAQTERAYEQLALSLAQQPEQLAVLRKRLADKRSIAPLFNSAKTTLEVECAFDEIYRRYQSGEAGTDISVQTGGTGVTLS
ncbi:MAG: tetratricopeptide repeat protein [Halioglobus sp.]|nr:tetratricopeptide repeat protein [Halioglobus sp.]